MTALAMHATELQIHMAVAYHLRVRARPGIWWAHYPAGEVRNAVTAAKLKGMGTKPGVPDILLLIGGKFHGLELKRQKGGRLSDTQRDMQAEITAAGGVCATAHGVDEAVAILSDWGALA